MNKISTFFKTQTISTQAKTTERVNNGTTFSRRADSGSNLWLSLKNIFSRTDKSSASAAVRKAVPQMTNEPIKMPQTKKFRSAPENRKIETPMASNLTEISNKPTEKKSNQLQNSTDKEPEQLNFEKFFKNDFNENLKSELDQTFIDSSLFNKNVIRATNDVLTSQMNDDSQILKKENILKGIESKLNSQFSNSIEDDTMKLILDAVSISFDFADAQELRRMNELASQ